jgi:hypothetical protein
MHYVKCIERSVLDKKLLEIIANKIRVKHDKELNKDDINHP